MVRKSHEVINHLHDRHHRQYHYHHDYHHYHLYNMSQPGNRCARVRKPSWRQFGLSMQCKVKSGAGAEAGAEGQKDGAKAIRKRVGRALGWTAKNAWNTLRGFLCFGLEGHPRIRRKAAGGT